MDAKDLAGHSLFEGLDPDQLERCAHLFSDARILAGSGLTRQGDFSYKFFIVLDGRVEVLQNFKHVANLGPGDAFGELGVLGDVPRNARVVADTGCHIAWIMSWDFKTLIDEIPMLAERIRSLADQRIS